MNIPKFLGSDHAGRTPTGGNGTGKLGVRELAFNMEDQKLFTYDGKKVIELCPQHKLKMLTRETKDFTATKAQKSFAWKYDKSNLEVLVDGILVQPTFYAANGTTVIFNNGLDLDTWVQLAYYKQV